MNVIHAVQFKSRSDSTIEVTEPESDDFVSSARETRVTDRENENAEDIITTGFFPFETEEAARDYCETLVDDLESADEYEASVRLTPLGSVHTGEVQAWYQNNPERIPESHDEDNPPRTWDSSRHIITEESG